MALKDVREPREVVTFQGGDFMVKGLTLPDILPLVRDHGVPVAALIGKAREIYTSKDTSALGSLGAVALSISPDLVVDILMAAQCDPDDANLTDADARAILSRLPAPVQIEALCKIWTLTMVVEGGMGNFAATISIALQSLTGDVAALLAPKLN